MFKTIILLASFVGALAFAPAASRASSPALKMSFENAVGAQAPLGFWDPLGKHKHEAWYSTPLQYVHI